MNQTIPEVHKFPSRKHWHNLEVDRRSPGRILSNDGTFRGQDSPQAVCDVRHAMHVRFEDVDVKRMSPSICIRIRTVFPC